jgi:hypothetical protein
MESEWSSSLSGCFTPGESLPISNWIDSWVGAIADMNVLKRKILPAGNRSRTVNPKAHRYTDSAVVVYSIWDIQCPLSRNQYTALHGLEISKRKARSMAMNYNGLKL